MAKALKNVEQMRIVTVPVDSIKVNPNNPRVIKDDKFKKLVQSVKDFPEMLSIRPVVVNSDMVVLGGNMRLRACIEADMKTIPIIIADNLTEEQQREFLIKDNVSGGEWDWDVLANDWDAGQLDDWGLDVPGMVGKAENDPFDDNGTAYQAKYGVIVMCTNENEQEKIYGRLTGEGLTCKIVVT